LLPAARYRSISPSERTSIFLTRSVKLTLRDPPSPPRARPGEDAPGTPGALRFTHARRGAAAARVRRQGLVRTT
jgi:hypothetical protein